MEWMMDKIQLALKRSKEKRENSGSSTRADAPCSPGGRPERIVYTRTRSVKAPLSHMREHRVISAFEENEFVHAYKILRTQVIHRMRENGWNMLGVTSPGEKEGKTVTAVNLAISLAMEVGQTVLLVDADLRNPGVHRVFGIETDRGLAEYLADDISVESLLVHPDVGRVVVLPGGRKIGHSAERLTSPKMVALAEELKRRYPARMVLFDLPPLLNSADVLAFSPRLDAMMLVVEAGRTKKEEIEWALHLLRGTPLIGMVLNKGRGNISVS
jgi:capsular exopolysaccharide synthesis family protein